MDIEITDVTAVERQTEAEMEEQRPRLTLQITDVSGVAPFQQTASAARAAIEPGKSATAVAMVGLVAGFLSYSQVDLYTQCKLAYFKRYHEKKRPKKHPAARLGTTVHKVLEEIFRWALAVKYRGKFPLQEAFKILGRVWRDPKEGLAGEPHVWWDDACTMIRNFAQANPSLDASQVLGVELSEEDEDGESRPKPVDLGGYPFVAKIDRVDRLGATSALVTDYKSDRTIRYKEEVDRDLQLTIYEIVTRRRFPWVKEVVLELFMLRHGIAQRARVRTEGDLEDAERFVAEVGYEIVHETDWTPKLNRWCHTCGYKGECPAYKEALEGGTTEEAMLARDLVQIGESRFDDLGPLRDQYDHRGKILEKRQKEIDNALKAYLELMPGNSFTTADREYYVGVSSRKKFPRLKTTELLSRRFAIPEAFVDAKLASIEKALLDKALERLGKGKTLGEVFEIEAEKRTVPEAQLKLLRIELDTLAEITSSTHIMSRQRKTPEPKGGGRAGALAEKEERAKTARIPAELVARAAAESRIAFELRGEGSGAAESPAPAVASMSWEDATVETGADVLTLWTRAGWARVEAEGVQPREVAANEEMAAEAALALWARATERTPRAAATRPGVLGRATRVAEPAPGPVASPPASAAEESPPPSGGRKRRQLSPETRERMSRAAKERWAKSKAGGE